MERTPCTSSNIKSCGYDPVTKTLEVEFVNKGAVYQYFDVGSEVHQALVNSGSVGQYFQEHIRGAFRYARVG